jgi:hypothetical protein
MALYLLYFYRLLLHLYNLLCFVHKFVPIFNGLQGQLLLLLLWTLLAARYVCVCVCARALYLPVISQYRYLPCTCSIILEETFSLK